MAASNSLLLRDSTSAEMEFNNIFKTYYKRLCLYAFQFVHDRDDAEDIVQACFIKLWGKIGSVELSYNIGSLLYTMVRNASYDHLRASASRGRVGELPAFEELADDDDTRKITLAETMQEIYQLTQGLPEKCREIFRLLFIEGKENAEIARELNITESTIRSQKAKAISFLKLNLGRLAVMGILLIRELKIF